MNRVIAEEIAALEAASAGFSRRPRILIHSSDVDELIDPHVVARLAPGAAELHNASMLAEDRSIRRMLWSDYRSDGRDFGCVSPRLRVFLYGEHCAIERLSWMRSTLFTPAWFNATSDTAQASNRHHSPYTVRAPSLRRLRSHS